MRDKRRNSILYRVVRLVFSAVPVNCVISVLLSVLLMVYYTLSVRVMAQLFESVNAYLQRQGGAWNYVVAYAAAFVLLRLLQSVLIFAQGVNGNVFVYRKATDTFRRLLSDKAAKIPLISYEDARVADMYKRAQSVIDEEKLSDQFMGLLNILNSLLAVLGIGIVLAGYHPIFLVIAIPSVLPFMIMRLLRGKEFYKMKFFQAKTKRKMDYYWKLLFSKDSMKEIHTYEFGHYIQNKWRQCGDSVDKELWAFKSKDAVIMLLLNIIALAGYMVSVCVSLYLWVNQKIGIGVFGASLSAFLTMQSETKKFLIGVGNIAEDLQFDRDYIAFLDLPETSVGSKVLEGIPDEIELRHVNFSYPNSQERVIRDVSFKIKKGESVAFVGENGSGKTTLIKLLLGMFDCESGEVLYGGEPVSDLQKESLYGMLSLMLQNATKHKNTLREAVAMREVQTVEEEQKIRKALQMAKVDYLIDNRGLDMRLGAEFGGRELSGGEWQRVALARALFQNGDFLVLDEPTSAIDPIAELDILKTVLDYFQGKTSIIISHRVGICTCVDKVVLIKEGQVAEMGTHQELMERQGAYYKLFNAQAKWYQQG